MTLQIIVDVFSGRQNPMVELDGREAQDALKRLAPAPAEAARASALEGVKEPGSVLGYRGLIVQQKGARNKRFPSRFRVFDGRLFGTAEPWRISDTTFEANFLSRRGAMGKFKATRGLRLDGLFDFRGALNESTPPQESKGNSPKRGSRSRRPRPCRCAPEFEPLWWNDGGQRQSNNNCYNYATNYRTDTFAQPGRAAGTLYQVLGNGLWGQAIAAGALPAAGTMYQAINCADVLAAALRDDLVLPPHQENECPEEGHLVALVIAPGYDFHWYRRGRNGYWTHKPGGTAATNRDNSNALIVDPRTADRGPYTDFCDFLVVHHGHIKIL
jgi:hypothetical protein